MAPRILHVVTNVAHYDDPEHPTGLWLSELVHAWDVFDEHGFEQRIVSPKGGHCPLEPRSLKFPSYDKASKAWHEDPEKMALLDNTLSPDDIDPADFDAIYFTGGHATMYDFPDSEGLKQITTQMWDDGKVVSSVCHGYCGLLNVTLPDGTNLVDGRKLTGFAWQEEVLAGVSKLVPYNVEEEIQKRGAIYDKALVPFASHVVTDGNLVTGQNPTSATKTAEAVVEILTQSGSSKAND